ncbi:hypothetical protein [Luteolibacter marinus]|uniref:hypothetical protein n=1 Tax=Luteolibacter marinus TaxID=2776705 RepID=UPI001866ADAD|nr:hypothetical protein [Luteolibacter marinus]
MARRRPRKTWQWVLLLIAAAVLWWLDHRNELPAGKLPTGAYQSFAGCRWVDHRQNDGDSFRVRLPDGRVEQFRLYYVDAPESDFRRYKGGRNNFDRIHDQAKDLGISDEQAVEIGRQAKAKVHQWLASTEFTVFTAWDDPFGDHRYHAFIAPPDGPMVHEFLVINGLARIHTKAAGLPDGTSVHTRLRELREFERIAKRDGRGAWGLVIER